jgi:hypothetical protein
VTAQLSGNPLALSEIADTLTAEELAGNRPLRLPLPAARTSDRIFGPRVAALDHQTRRALCLAAVGAADGLAVVPAALSAQGISRSAVEALEGSGLVSFTDGQIRFVHPLLRWFGFLAADDGIPNPFCQCRNWHTRPTHCSFGM